MTVDNELYTRLAHTWWQNDGVLHVLAALVPVRIRYLREVLVERLRLNPRQTQVLDIGCGGGLLAEALARLGFSVVGVDPAEASLAAARDHAQRAGLAIEYRQGRGEDLPLPDASVDVAVCCDVLEHVPDLDRVIAETARVLAPGGVYVYETINRTLISKLFLIKAFQEWSWTRIMPPHLHDWRQFITPHELLTLLDRHGLEHRDLAGLRPTASLLRMVHVLRQCQRGAVTYAEAVRRMQLSRSRDTRLIYLGYAVRRKVGPAERSEA